MGEGESGGVNGGGREALRNASQDWQRWYTNNSNNTDPKAIELRGYAILDPKESLETFMTTGKSRSWHWLRMGGGGGGNPSWCTRWVDQLRAVNHARRVYFALLLTSISHETYTKINYSQFMKAHLQINKVAHIIWNVITIESKTTIYFCLKPTRDLFFILIY